MSQSKELIGLEKIGCNQTEAKIILEHISKINYYKTMQEQQLTLNEMKRGALYYNEAKGRTERYIGNVSHIRPVMDYHKQEQEAAMIRDVRIANKSEVDKYVDETNANFAANVKITRSS